MSTELISKITQLDIQWSKRLFSYDGGPFLNFFCYMFSSIFMEEMALATLIALHFFFGRVWVLSFKYITIFVANLLVTLITKKVFNRARPESSDFTKSTKTMFFRNKQGNKSMPSGDTIQAWALAVYVSMCLDSGLFWVVWPCAIFIPFSRVYLCCHFITDVLFGAFLAVVTSVVVICAFEDPVIKSLLMRFFD